MIKSKVINWLYIIILLIILFFPKINIINVPGTYVGIRIEDILALLFVVAYLVKENKKIKLLFNDKRLTKTIICFFVYFFICTISTIMRNNE